MPDVLHHILRMDENIAVDTLQDILLIRSGNPDHESAVDMPVAEGNGGALSIRQGEGIQNLRIVFHINLLLLPRSGRLPGVSQ